MSEPRGVWGGCEGEIWFSKARCGLIGSTWMTLSLDEMIFKMMCGDKSSIAKMSLLNGSPVPVGLLILTSGLFDTPRGSRVASVDGDANYNVLRLAILRLSRK